MTRATTVGTVAALLVAAVSLAAAVPVGASRSFADRVEAEFKSGEIVIAGAPRALGRRYQVLRHYPRSDLNVVSVEVGGEKAALLAARAAGHRAGLNFVVEAFLNDPYFPYQWNLTAVQAQAAWETTDGAGAVVAVLDTGLTEAGANDGIGCVLGGYNAIADSSDVSDGHGHGTHVSGTVAQASNNGVGVAGLAHGACVMPVKVLNDGGSGTLVDVAEGIYWAVDQGAHVINMSLGLPASSGTTSDPVLDPALAYAFSNDVTVVVASGNDGSTSNVSYPASHSSTIAVGAVGATNVVTDYSNQGVGLDLVAPGGDTSVDLNGDYFPDGVLQETHSAGSFAYYFYQGTSMASPHVAAAAALLYANGTASTPAAVLEAFTSTATDLGASGYDGEYGFGLLQAHAALQYSGGGSGCEDGDDDGWCTTDNDCDDGDASVHPGAAEVCGDGVDNNCDGAVDEGCNVTPTAAWSHSCEDLSCSFTDQSADVDGQIVSWLWDFGDGTTSTDQNPSHTYAAAGSYTCTLTVTDDQGAGDSSATQVTVTEPDPGPTPEPDPTPDPTPQPEPDPTPDPTPEPDPEPDPSPAPDPTPDPSPTPDPPAPEISLDAKIKYRRGRAKAVLYWDGATSGRVDVWKNGSFFKNTRNDGRTGDRLNSDDRGWLVYQVCEEGTSICSNEAAVYY